MSIGAEALTGTIPVCGCFPDCRIKDSLSSWRIWRTQGILRRPTRCRKAWWVADDHLRIQDGDAQRKVGFGRHDKRLARE